MQLSMRPAAEEDMDQIMVIEKESFSTPWPWSAFQEEIVHTKWSRVVLAESEKGIVGFVVYWLVAAEIHLLNLAVDKKSRRLGIGKALLKYMLNDGLENNCKQFFLEVRTSNRIAIMLYKNSGFKELDLRKGYYTDNGEDALIMNLDLTDRRRQKRRAK